MNRLVTGIENNPDYPQQDINSETADLLSMMLQNYEITTDMHMAAEQAVAFYSQSHHTINILARRLGKETLEEGLHMGATTFEAISSMVRPISPKPASLMTPDILRTYLPKGGIIPTIELLEHAMDEFVKYCPNTSYVVSEVAMRRAKALAAPALMAAGISRQIELEIIDAA